MLNISPASWTQGGQWHMEWKSLPRHDMALLLAASVGIVAWVVMMVYRREGKSLHFMSRWSLIGLRLMVLGGILVMLLEPVLVFSRIDHVPSNLIILSDVSGSMDLNDAYSDAHTITGITAALNIREQELQKSTRRQLIDRALDQGLRKKLEANGDRIVHPQDFAARLLPPTTQPRGANDSDTAGTAIGVAIRQAIGTYQGQPIAGVLLLSDGQNNTGEDPEVAARFAGAAGVPVVSLAVGTAMGPKWARITKVDVAPVIVFNDRALAHVLVESHGMNGVPATVKLYRSEEGGPPQEIGSQTLQLGETGQQQTVQFDFTEPAHDSAVKLQLYAVLENAGAELKPADHHSNPVDVKAINDKMRVLFIAGETFPEVEFIRAKLLRDPHISASTWNQTADVGYEQPGDPAILRLPETAEELKEYDCIILYDPDPNLWPSGFSDLLNDFVGKDGGGLIFVAGERNTKNLFDRPDDPTLSWLNMLPVQVEPGLYHTDVSVKLSSQNAWKLEITPEGKADPIFDFANHPDHPEDNEAIYESLPGMYWHFPVTRARAGATVLARHGDPRMHNEHGQHVLLATQLVGAGRTFFCAFDSTYRWRYLDDQYFESFWSHLVDRAGHAKQWGGTYPYKLSTDRTEYRPGSQVTVSAHFDNPLDRGPGLESMHGEVRVGGSTEPGTEITLTPRPGDPNTFDATFSVEKPVTHSVFVWSGDADIKNAHPAKIDVTVNSPNLEYDNPGLNTGVLQAIAKASGGKMFELADFNKIPDAFTTRRVDHPLEDRQEIWNAPLIFGLVLTCIVLEWVLRKKLQLV
jgi:hypothetical protein